MYITIRLYSDKQNSLLSKIPAKKWYAKLIKAKNLFMDENEIPAIDANNYFLLLNVNKHHNNEFEIAMIWLV